MRFYQHTGNFIFLIGHLIKMPMLINTKSGDCIVLIQRHYFCDEEMKNKTEEYRVLVNKNDAVRINHFGFPGMLLFVHGEMRLKNKIEIIASKIDFVNFPRDNFHDDFSNYQKMKKSEQDLLLDFENSKKSYWFDENGKVRKDYLTIH